MANKPRLRFKGIFATIKAVQKCTVFLCLRGHRECTLLYTHSSKHREKKDGSD